MTDARGIANALLEDDFDPEEVEALASIPIASEFPKGHPDNHAWIYHSCEPADYFQGASVYGWDDVYTGSGDTDDDAAHEAFQEAADDGWNLAGIPMPADLSPDFHTRDWVLENVSSVDIVPPDALRDVKPSEREAAADHLRDHYIDAYMEESNLYFYYSLKLRRRK